MTDLKDSLYEAHKAALLAAMDKIGLGEGETFRSYFGDALSVPDDERNSAQREVVAEYMAFNDRCVEINRNADAAAIEIEKLTPDEIETWKVPVL